MNDICISDIIEINNRFVRSIQIERDFGETLIHDYIVTPNVEAIIKRLVIGLTNDSHQRAWRITGDYGTGKSSFALALTHLLTGNNHSLPLPLEQAVDFHMFGIERPHFLPVLVNGSREQITVALLRSLQRSLERCKQSRERAKIMDKLHSFVSCEASPDSDMAVINLLEEINDYVCKTGSGTGILVILDELGKFLEYAALHPDRQDVFFLQSLAEAAARSGKQPLVVVGMLHQGFNAYAEQLSQTMQKEWEKVAGRFEELLFDQPLEQTACLVAKALNVHTEQLTVALAEQATNDMKKTLDLGWYGQSASNHVLWETAKKLFPLHPTVIPVLSKLFSRFGQNERSLFSFLHSNEPFALKDFLTQPLKTATFYRIHNLYDYARITFGHKLSVQSYRSHWKQIESIVESFPLEHQLELQILKTVALLNLLDVPSLLATEDVIRISIGDYTKKDLSQFRDAIHRLQKEKCVLYYRGIAGGYCLWPHTSVNLEKAYHEACQAIGVSQSISSLIMQSLETRPLVARRHYIETGNLRHFDICYAPVPELSDYLKQDREFSDGCIIIPLCETEEEHQEAFKFAKSTALKKRPDVLIAIPKPIGALVSLVQECQRWEWISQNILELNNDRYAAEEVSRQFTASRQLLEKRMCSYVGLRQFTGNMELVWFKQGRPLSINCGRELLSNISNICDKLYDQAPRIKNELVNRHLLSSAAAAARLRLIERILEFPRQPKLGMDPAKKPPEMSMYLSILMRAGLHKEIDGGWSINEPSRVDDPFSLFPVFECIHKMVEGNPDSRIRVSDIFTQLRRRPFGVRDGLAPILLAIFAVVNEHDMAFYEDGAFIRQLTGQEFRRLLKAPETFEIQHCKVSGVRSIVFQELLKLLIPLNPQNHNTGKAEILDVVRPLCVFAAQLPEYTIKTSTISREAAAIRETLLRAEDPAALVFYQLPAALNMEPFKDDQSPDQKRVKQFVDGLRVSLQELQFAYQSLIDRLREGVLTTFDRPGNFDRFREEMGTTVKRLLVAVTEPRLKSFCLRLGDNGLSERPWLESLGSFLCSKPPARWMDADLIKFQEELHELAGRFRRVESTIFEGFRNEQSSATRVALTSQDGTEVTHIIYMDNKEEDDVRELENLFLQTLRKNKRIGLAAASQAMWKYIEEYE